MIFFAFLHYTHADGFHVRTTTGPLPGPFPISDVVDARLAVWVEPVGHPKAGLHQVRFPDGRTAGLAASELRWWEERKRAV